MDNNEILLRGFKITVRSLADKNAEPGAISIIPEQFAEKISDFIKTRLLTNDEINVRLSIEKWDETFELQESSFNIRLDLPAKNTYEYARNYWIETK